MFVLGCGIYIHYHWSSSKNYCVHYSHEPTLPLPPFPPSLLSLLHFLCLFKKLLFKYSCLHFPLTTPAPSPPPTLNPIPLWFCPCVLYIFSLMTLSLFTSIIPSTLPSCYCQFVLYFNVSGYVLLACLFC